MTATQPYGVPTTRACSCSACRGESPATWLYPRPTKPPAPLTLAEGLAAEARGEGRVRVLDGLMLWVPA